MPILSPEFAVFFVLLLLPYWALQRFPQAQNALLLAASLGLLTYLHPFFAVAVSGYSFFVTVCGRLISRAENQRLRKALLALSVCFALAVLAFFKYYDFLRPLLHEIYLRDFGEILIPLGLSYYVFQSVAYLVAVYRQEIPVMLWYEVWLHLSFFPTITAGPILRAARFTTVRGLQPGAAVQMWMPGRQLLSPALACTLLLLGTAKVWCFSGQIAAQYVEPVLQNPLQYGSLAILGAIYGYTLQLFFDFSGYSDLVIALALLLGFRLPQNFAAPLFAANLREFWQRWHITLSTWIRDYVYIPLGGSRKGFFRTQINIMIAMVLSGIWHGSGWHFFVWGALHGAGLVLLNLKEKIFGRARGSLLGKAAGIVITFNFVAFAFIIFKLDTLEEARQLFAALIHTRESDGLAHVFPLLVLYLGIFLYPLWIKLLQLFVKMLGRLPIYLWMIPLFLLLQLIATFAPEGIPGFIYANF